MSDMNFIEGDQPNKYEAIEKQAKAIVIELQSKLGSLKINTPISTILEIVNALHIDQLFFDLDFEEEESLIYLNGPVPLLALLQLFQQCIKEIYDAYKLNFVDNDFSLGELKRIDEAEAILRKMLKDYDAREEKLRSRDSIRFAQIKVFFEQTAKKSFIDYFLMQVESDLNVSSEDLNEYNVLKIKINKILSEFELHTLVNQVLADPTIIPKR